MGLPAVVGIALALGAKGRWVYHLVSNNFSVRKANQATGTDIETLHDFGDEFIAVCKVVFRLDPYVERIETVAKELGITYRLLDRFTPAQRERINSVIQLSQKLETLAHTATAHECVRLMNTTGTSPTDVLNQYYLGLHLAGYARFSISGKALEDVVTRLIDAHKKRRHASDRAAVAVLKKLGHVSKRELAHTFDGTLILSRIYVPHARTIAAVLLCDFETSDIPHGLGREIAARYGKR